METKEVELTVSNEKPMGTKQIKQKVPVKKVLLGIAGVAAVAGITCLAWDDYRSKSENRFLEEGIAALELENLLLQERIVGLVNLCEEKDSHFKGLMSDGLRHGSSLAASYMCDRNRYLQSK